MTKKKDEKPLFESTHEMRDEAGNLLGYVFEPTAEHRAIVEKWLVPFNDGNPPTRMLLGTFADDFESRVTIPTSEELQQDLENGIGAPWGINRRAVLSEIGLGHGVSFSLTPFVSSSHQALLNSILEMDCLAGMAITKPTIQSTKSYDELVAELTEVLKTVNIVPPKVDVFYPWDVVPRKVKFPIGEEVMEQRRLSLPHQIPTIKLSAIQDQVDAYCSTHEDDSAYPPAAEGECYDSKAGEPTIFSDKWHVIPADWIRWRFFDKYGYTTSASTERVTVAAMLEIVKEAEVIRRKLRTLRSGISNVFVKKPEFYVPGTRLISLKWVVWIAIERGITFEEAYRNSIKD